MALYNTAELTKANHALVSELRAATEALKTAQASVTILRAADAGSLANRSPAAVALGGAAAAAGRAVMPSSRDAAAAFAPTAEDLANKRAEASAAEAKRGAEKQQGIDRQKQ
jgi:hypothetical protein